MQSRQEESRVPIPEDEQERIEALQRYRILDTEPEEAFERIVRLCERVFQVPVAFVSLVERHRQWFKAVRGLDLCETDREIAFCSYVIYHGSTLVVEDAKRDPRFAENPLVKQPPGVRFYAGAPLTVEGGKTIGTLCLAGYEPRSLRPEELDTLEELAALAVDELDLRLAAYQLDEERRQVARNARELERINLELQQAKEEAERGNRAKTQFLSNMSHELRTPLNAVLGFAQMLEQDERQPLAERHAQYVEQILKGGRHLLELINDVLDLARVEAGRVELQPGPVDPAAVLRECTQLIQPLADDAEVHLEVDIAADTPTIQSDPRRLRQIAINLMSNAVKYNHAGGRVTAGIGPNADGGVRLQISDTGRGIPAERQRELFHPFNRLGLEHSGVEGTGVGLVVTRRLVERMGGEIRFSSEYGVGSVFWVDMPQTLPAVIDGDECG